MSAEIWAIGGGKGGTGKTFLTSSLAIYLAQMGKQVTLIDADLGGANLHSVLKINKPKHSLTDFFEKKVPLSDIIDETGIPNLRLVTGDIRTLTSDSVNFGQRHKLFRHIKHLSGDYVLIDLGAGSNVNTLDTFLMADKMVVVTLPEITSIENLYLFIKKAMFRKLNLFLGDHQLRNAAKVVWKNRKENEIKTIRHLVNHFKSISGEVKEYLDNEFSHFKLHLILNQVRHTPHIQTGASIKSVMRKYFGIESLFSGYVKYNESFWQYVNQSTPFLRLESGQPVMDEIGVLVRAIMEDTQVGLSEIAGEVSK